ncbi:MAG: hypothetical protein MUE44_17980 [Oscillatoriaceae cyanobacterium Prado104]|jgi:type II secretory pathway pseudopilin PulG|nr:hypothetical protein [Oscillatoriaceae cyanobacterium Prado104]
MPLNIIHPELQKLFRKCFNDGHHKPNARPSAADWETALEVAISELAQCSVESGHHYAKSYGKCYWCERKRQLSYDMFASPSGMPKPTVSPVTNKNPIKQQQVQPVKQQVQPIKPVVTPVNNLPIKPPPKPNKIKNLIGTGAIMLTLSAISLPSFFNQANKAKQSKAKQDVASMNKAQQAFFAEKTSFASNISDLGLGIKAETDNYKYQISKQLNDSVVIAVAEPKQSGLKGYVGIVLASEPNMKLPGVTTSALYCEQSQASTSFPDLSKVVSQRPDGGHNVNCPVGYVQWESTQNSTPNSNPKEEVRSQTNSSTPSDSTERVNFDKGSTGATISNSIITNQKKRYLLNCGSGERMTVKIRQGDINIAIIAPNGQTIGNAVNGATQWQGQLPSDGDYIIEVSAPNQSNYTLNIEVLPSINTPVSSTPEQTIKNFYELTVKDNKAAGKAFTTEEFKKKNNPKQTDPQKTWVSTFNFIEVTQIETIEKSPTRAKMKVWLRYSFKDGRPEACEYRDCTLVLKNNKFLIDDIGEYTPISCS